MKRLVATVICLLLFTGPCLAGQVYQWIDKNGVTHFTNEPPPAGARIVEEGKEIPYDAAKDKARRESDATFLQQTREADQPAAATKPVPTPPSQPEKVEVETGGETWSQDQIEKREKIHHEQEWRRRMNRTK
jgi:hypothetical protein